MFNFIRTYQLDIMLVLRAMSFMMAIMLFITRFLPKRRKWILIGMELVATLLLSFDRLAYIYAGNPTSLGYVMVRLSNFMVFFLTPGTVFLFTIYLEDLFEKNAVVLKTKTLTIVGIICIISMFFRIVNIFTGFYYFFDEANRYQRGPGFLIVYLVPVICPLIQFGVIQKYRHSLSRYIYLALVLYIFVPITMGIIQIFSYGISIVNMSMVLVSISLYFFTYFDINDEVERAHVLEMRTLKEEQRQMKNLFSHTANAFVKAIEKRDESLKGESEKAALIARKLAEKYGLSEEKCDEVYYAALLHNAGFSSLPDSFFAAEEINWNSNLINGELPKLSSEILSEIKEFPYLSIAVRYMNERFDGKDNKLGLKGKEIPEISRILSITEEYCKMTYSNKFSNSVPVEVVREELLKESGFKFDPDLSDAMIKLIDEGISENSSKHNFSIESNLTSDSYREHVSKGIPVLQTETEITLRSVPLYSDGIISAPSLIVFDSLDQKVHSSQTSIEAFRYTEYGELWFDGHTISTNARNIQVKVTNREVQSLSEMDFVYKITAGRYDDHILICLEHDTKLVNITVALPDSSKSAYIALTGENAVLSEIKVKETGIRLSENDISRIAEKISFIDRIETDIPNIQIDGPRVNHTEGVLLNDNMTIAFHSMSFPESNFVWNCPFVVLYYSKDGKVGGEDYCEYALIKLDGESGGSNLFAENRFEMKKKTFFKDWNEWKSANRNGLEYEVDFHRRGNIVTVSTETLGLFIQNTTIIKNDARNAPKEVYVALTGDKCALTDIRLR